MLSPQAIPPRRDQSLASVSPTEARLVLLPFCAPERLVDVERFGMCSELYSIGALLLWTMVEDETEFQNSPIAIVEKFMSDGPEMYDQSTRERVGQVFLRTLHTEEN